MTDDIKPNAATLDSAYERAKSRHDEAALSTCPEDDGCPQCETYFRRLLDMQVADQRRVEAEVVA